MSELEQLLDEKSVALEGVDEVEVERESLAILATLRTTKEYLSKDMTLADVHRLSKKDVRKYYKMYQMLNGQQVYNTLAKGTLGIFSKVVSHIITIDSPECLATDLREDRLVQRPGRGGGYSLIWAIKVCVAPKGMVFQPFWS